MSVEPPADLRGPGTADLIADEVRRRILDGRFASGHQINEVHLANELQVSRGPVREAVQRLVQEGLLVARRHRGTSVVQLGAADIADIYRARMAVEREAGRVVMTERTATVADELDAVLETMSEALRSRTWASVARADLRFHQTIVDAASSRRLSAMFSTLAAESLLCMHRFEAVFDPPEEIIGQHRRLAELLRAGDPELYLAEVDWHMANSVRRLVAAMGE